MTAALPEILFVDDSTAHVQIAREALLAPGMLPHRLSVASTGADALDRMLLRPPYEYVRPPDLVMLDLDVPLVSGFDVLAAVKTDAGSRAIPVVVLVRSASKDDVDACYALGANSVVNCPVRLEALAETYRTVAGYWLGVNRRAPPGPR